MFSGALVAMWASAAAVVKAMITTRIEVLDEEAIVSILVERYDVGPFHRHDIYRQA